MITTNTISLTESQEDKMHLVCRGFFNSEKDLEVTHFSFNGTRLNFDSMRIEGVIEIHTEEGQSMWLLFDFNDKKEVLKSTLKLQK